MVLRIWKNSQRIYFNLVFTNLYFLYRLFPCMQKLPSKTAFFHGVMKTIKSSPVIKGSKHFIFQPLKKVFCFFLLAQL